MSPRPVGVVLAGGASRRMGRDKAGVAIDGEPLALRAARRLASACPEVLVADRGRGLVPGFASVRDGPARGPAAGILGAAAVRPGRALLVLACDLPEVTVALLAALARAAGCDLALPRWRRGLEPLCARWGPAASEALARRAAAGDPALHAVAAEPGLEVRLLEGQALQRFGDPERLFLNLNTPEDLARYLGSPASGC